MEPRTRQETRAQQPLGFRSTKKLLRQQQRNRPGDGKEPPLPKQYSSKEKEQQTWPPALGSKPSERRLKEKLPEKLMLLEELYHSMEAAISLLHIRHNICTFSTIVAAVEGSTHRRFLRTHLAQMKHILPEALHIEEYISWDAESQCSHRDLRISLLPILNKESGSLQRYSSPQKSTDMVVRRQEFHRRLLEFHCQNKEVDVDVPQASMFEGGTDCCHSLCNAELPKSLPAHVECLQEKEKVGGPTDERANCFQEDCVELPDMELPPPPLFNIAHLRKFPRSPSKLSQQRRVSPAPPHATMSHLPPVFKRHFSVKGQIDLVDSGNKFSEVTPESVSLLGSIEAVRPHFSLKRCKKVDVPPATPQKTPIQSITPETHAVPCPALAPAVQPSYHMSPPAAEQIVPVGEPTCRTPAQSGSSASVTSPPSATPLCTPQQAILTPLPSITPSVTVTIKEAAGVPVKRRKQAVIKSLRFGTPNRHADLDKTKLKPVNDTDAASPCATSDAILSPVKTPANDTFVVPKNSSGNVSRVLPFNSPAGAKKKQVPQFISHEDGMHTPKRAKLSRRQLLEFEPCNNNEQDLTEAGNSCLIVETTETAMGVQQSLETRFVDLSSMSGADKLSASDVEILKCLPQDLLHDVRAKERQHLQDIQSGLEESRRRQQLIVGLPKLFNMVRLLFQSGNRTVLTRKDLLKMVLSSHPDITDRDEIMEQLQLLVDLAPEWISTNRSSTGDILYRINKNANMRAVSKALVEAK